MSTRTLKSVKELSVVIPAYNEADRIAYTLMEVAEYFRRKHYQFEIIVINDGSTDDTLERIESVKVTYPEIRLVDRRNNKGKGQTVKEGIMLAKFAWCLFMDADNSTSIHEWDKFEKAFEDGADAVSATRHLPESNVVFPQPFMRRFLGSGYRVICRLLFGLTLSDFNCGFKALRTDLAKTTYAHVHMRDWTFDVEVFCLLKQNGIVSMEVPVRWEHREKRSGIAPVRTALRTLGSILQLKKRF